MDGGLELDHVVVGVADLDAAATAARSRGFSVTPGGRHRGFGTRNMLIRFRTAYLELITVTDPGEARAAGRGSLVDRIADQGDGFVAYALRTGSVTTLLDRAAGARAAMTGPVHMTRTAAAVRGAPPPAEAAWTLAKPFGDQYGGWWPFFIEWARGGPGSAGYSFTPHPNGAEHIADITVAASDLDAAATWMRQICQLRPHGGPSAGARATTYPLRNASVRFVRRDDCPPPARTQPGGGLVSVTVAAPSGPGRSGPPVAPPAGPAASWLDRVAISVGPSADPDSVTGADPDSVTGAGPDSVTGAGR